ncbi:MAG: hypothetical protein ACI81R_001342 [Bradymonadia bacterium]|jgi:hypothetical protein
MRNPATKAEHRVSPLSLLCALGVAFDAVLRNIELPTIDRFEIIESPGIAETAQWGIVSGLESAASNVYATEGALVVEGGFRRLGNRCFADSDCGCDGVGCSVFSGLYGSDEWCELQDLP